MAWALFLFRRVKELFCVCFVATVVQVICQFGAEARVLADKFQFWQRPKVAKNSYCNKSVQNVFYQSEHVYFKYYCLLVVYHTALQRPSRLRIIPKQFPVLLLLSLGERSI